jgi:succinate dehydrogenase / fumarate reductase cytochrome b subunit
MGIHGFGSFFGRHEFVIRRLHSITGLLPVGGYLAFHLATNAAVIDGAETYQRRANQIHAVGPTTLFFLEWCLVLLPILFHALVGMVIVSRGKRNLLRYPFAGNIRYTLQRITGVAAFAFILWHVFQMRGWCAVPWWTEHVTRRLGGARFEYQNAAETASKVISSSAWVIAAYVAGVVVSVYHFGNGIWTVGTTWGVWTSPAAQRRANYPCAAVGIVLLLIGLGALAGMIRVPAAGAASHFAAQLAVQLAALAVTFAGAAMLIYRKGT